MTKRFFLEISYKGTDYCGWQVQPNQVTIQQKVNEALSTILNEPIMCLGCGRTDSGVHASQFFLHFAPTKPIPEKFVFRLNKFLPSDIAVKRLIINVPEDAHARFDATYRAYDYYAHFNKSPFLYQSSFFFPWLPLDVESMNTAAQLLLQYEDFRMFCKSGHSSKTTLCQIFKAELHIDDVGLGGSYIWVAEAVSGERANLEVLEEDVGSCGDIEDRLTAVVAGHVQRDRSLVAIHRGVHEADVGVGQRHQRAGDIAARNLDLDDVGAEVPEHRTDERAGPRRGDLKHPYASERTGEVVASFSKELVLLHSVPLDLRLVRS